MDIIIIAILTFSLSLLGAFLVRSGVLISVHAFAVDPNRGIFMLVFLFLGGGGVISLFAFTPGGLLRYTVNHLILYRVKHFY